MRTVDNVLGFDSSNEAKFRFHVLQVYYSNGWKAVKTAFPHLSRPTLYRWKKVYESSGKRLNSLIPTSTKPHKIRSMQTPPSVVALITELRKKYPRLGKYKIKPFVDAFCTSEAIPTLDESTIGKVIKRHNLFFAGKGGGKRKRQNQAQKTRIKLCPKASNTKPGYIQLDGVKFYYIDNYYYFLTAIDIVSKQAWVKLVPSFKSKHAAAFLADIIQSSWYQIHTVQTDNGSEFELLFDQAVKEAQFNHLWSYPKHPKTNGFVERFNWTIQDEFLFNSEDYLNYPEEFNLKLTEWLSWYNTQRPHQSLNYLSPFQYSKERSLSQMS